LLWQTEQRAEPTNLPVNPLFPVEFVFSFPLSAGGAGSGGHPTIIDAITIGISAKVSERNGERADMERETDMCCPPGCKDCRTT
jgi:hypothetical protein